MYARGCLVNPERVDREADFLLSSDSVIQTCSYYALCGSSYENGNAADTNRSIFNVNNYNNLINNNPTGNPTTSRNGRYAYYDSNIYINDANQFKIITNSNEYFSFNYLKVQKLSNYSIMSYVSAK